MWFIAAIWISLFPANAGLHDAHVFLQDPEHHVIDFVDLPPEFSGQTQMKKNLDAWYLEFDESWLVDSPGGCIRKSVHSYRLHDRNAPLASPDSLSKGFKSLVRQMPVTNGSVRLRNISYEFVLLDPHLRESGNIGNSVQDSMDSRTRKLQKELISLLESRVISGLRNEFNARLLSVEFFEEWVIDPVTFRITKKVHGITPVIWQRRQTSAGKPVNDADTELPVYYKIKLNRVNLRNQ